MRIQLLPHTELFPVTEAPVLKMELEEDQEEEEQEERYILARLMFMLREPQTLQPQEEQEEPSQRTGGQREVQEELEEYT